ncbi:hypothetical protein RDI58_025944 [Solanum bulbocastanum]|uniref:Uncharacterized protein n=1 Tax=Solanum bulbocastanum TaxID=147425 RepID=A0AAN8Y2W1_SOLBU
MSLSLCRIVGARHRKSIITTVKMKERW